MPGVLNVMEKLVQPGIAYEFFPSLCNRRIEWAIYQFSDKEAQPSMEQQKYFEMDYKRYFEEGASKSSKCETAFAKVLFAQSYCY